MTKTDLQSHHTTLVFSPTLGLAKDRESSTDRIGYGLFGVDDSCSPRLLRVRTISFLQQLVGVTSSIL